MEQNNPYGQQQNNPYGQQQNPYGQPQNPYGQVPKPCAAPNPGKPLGIVGFALGISSLVCLLIVFIGALTACSSLWNCLEYLAEDGIVFSSTFLFLALACGITGWVLSSIGKKKSRLAGQPAGLAKPGFILSIIGTILTAVILVFVLIGVLACNSAANKVYNDYNW